MAAGRYRLARVSQDGRARRAEKVEESDVVRYVAVGDSFTEGVGDELPDGTVRGWADLVAAGLASATGGPVSYANFAIRGRLLTPIATEQVDAALALEPGPTMITINGGGNDMLRPGMDAERMLGLVEVAARRCLAAQCDVVLLCGPDPSQRLPLGRRFHSRGEQLTAGIHALGARLDVTVVDTFHDEAIRGAGYWGADRLHLNTAGHHRVARLVLEGIGYRGVTPAVDPDPVLPRTVRGEARYYSKYVGPWVARRLRGASSGDGRTAKYPMWVEVSPEGAGPVVKPATPPTP